MDMSKQIHNFFCIHSTISLEIPKIHIFYKMLQNARKINYVHW